MLYGMCSLKSGMGRRTNNLTSPSSLPGCVEIGNLKKNENYSQKQLLCPKIHLISLQCRHDQMEGRMMNINEGGIYNNKKQKQIFVTYCKVLQIHIDQTTNTAFHFSTPGFILQVRATEPATLLHNNRKQRWTTNYQLFSLKVA